MKNFFYIEFIGMPASGKSFYKNKILKFFGKNETISNDFYKILKILKILFFIIFSLKYMKFTLVTLNFLLTTKLNRREIKRHLYYFKNEAALRIYHEIKNKIVINSEGFRHRSIFFIYENLKKNKNFSYKNYLRSQPKTDLLIFVKSDKKKNILRSKNRKNGYKYSLKEIRNYNKKQQILEKIVNFTKKKGVLMVFETNSILISSDS